jgi:hypothetical protein
MAAVTARRFLVRDDARFFQMADFLEQLFRYGITYDVIENHEMPIGVEACSLPERLLMQLSEHTYNAACRDEPRARFTCIHELGHIVLAHARTLNRETPGRNIQAFEDSEWQANTFAAEFLMPLHLIQAAGMKSAAEIMLEFHASEPAAEVRIKKLQDRGEI